MICPNCGSDDWNFCANRCDRCHLSSGEIAGGWVVGDPIAAFCLGCGKGPLNWKEKHQGVARNVKGYDCYALSFCPDCYGDRDEIMLTKGYRPAKRKESGA